MKQIQQFLQDKGCNCAILFKTESPNPNFSYLSGFDGLGVLFIRQRARPLLFVPEPEYKIAQKSAKVEVINAGRQRILSVIKKRFSSSLITVAIDKSSVSLLQYPVFKKALGFKKAVDISAFLAKRREIKDELEIRLIRRSCKIAEEILARLINRLHTFKTESEACAFLISESAKEGVKPSFDPIVASAPNSGKWHHTPTTARIREGFLIIDFGVSYKGYSSDITRTVYKGTPKAKDLERYALVSQVQKECIKMIVPGARLIESQKYAQKILGIAFCHSLGHGIGRAVHEGPNFIKSAIIEEGMTLAIEPGIYFPGKDGIRIEDDIIITKNGPKMLTTPLKNLIRI